MARPATVVRRRVIERGASRPLAPDLPRFLQEALQRYLLLVGDPSLQSEGSIERRAHDLGFGDGQAGGALLKRSLLLQGDVELLPDHLTSVGSRAPRGDPDLGTCQAALICEN